MTVGAVGTKKNPWPGPRAYDYKERIYGRTKDSEQFIQCLRDGGALDARGAQRTSPGEQDALVKACIPSVWGSGAERGIRNQLSGLYAEHEFVSEFRNELESIPVDRMQIKLLFSNTAGGK